MDLQIEANRNSALFTTFQDVLDVYNPLLHKARPTVVNEAKHRIKVTPRNWGMTMSAWNGSQSVRFDIPRIASLLDFSVRCAFRIPGTDADTEGLRAKYGNRGYAKSTLTTGGLDNTRGTSDTAQGRLDRLYADRLLGFNMIRSYTVSSKTRVLFTAPGEYLLTRFYQMDHERQMAVLRQTTPVNIWDADYEETSYKPGLTYNMTIPLFMFFNEHITMALDVNFAEEVHIDIELRAPSELFYYGNLGTFRNIDGTNDTALLDGAADTALRRQGFFTQYRETSPSTSSTGGKATFTGSVFNSNPALWDMSYNKRDSPFDVSPGAWISFNQNYEIVDGGAEWDYYPLPLDAVNVMLDAAMNHIRGVSSPYYQWGSKYGLNMEWCRSSTTFAFPNVDNNGESILAQFEGIADFMVQDTDSYRALRAQSFPKGTGLTQIAYDVFHEQWDAVMNSATTSQNLLDARAGGTFIDPDHNTGGLTVGDTARSVDLEIRCNNLASQTHFFVRKVSDLGGTNTTTASKGTTVNYGKDIVADDKILGAHRIYTRCLPVHYFQILAAGRVIYESSGDAQLDLTQTKMYKGNGTAYSVAAVDPAQRMTNAGADFGRHAGHPFNIYTINWGLTASRLENTGCISWQNLNNPILRIYFKPDLWAEHESQLNSTSSEARIAASLGVRVDVLHEHFNIITINSGNGEITSGLNQ